MVRPGPYVNEYKRPEMEDTELIRINRPVGHFGQEVIHHAQVRRGEEKRYRIVPIPPLHQRILHTGEYHVAFPEGYGYFYRVYDVQYRYGNKCGDIEPDGHVQMPLAPFDDGAEHVPAENYPYDGDGDIYRPF